MPINQPLYVLLFCIFAGGADFADANNTPYPQTTHKKPSETSHSPAPKLQLAKTFRQDSDIRLQDYWASEKLDGVRAYWDGQTLRTRSGHLIPIPEALHNTLPSSAALDGELWIARGKFDLVSGLVRAHSAPISRWQKVQYKVFDLPKHTGTFEQRLSALAVLFRDNPNNFWSPLKQFKIDNKDALNTKLKEVEALGGEGLMLHLASSKYSPYRTDHLLKVKSYRDAEATVVGYTKGKGKYRGLVGALIVKLSNGITFNIGSGLDDHDRITPPAIGSTITFKYFGLTPNGVPRFASYMRTRHPVAQPAASPPTQ
ncbi:MAG TPA: DNA ligase [Marinagarivorans sp.]